MRNILSKLISLFVSNSWAILSEDANWYVSGPVYTNDDPEVVR